MKSFFSLSLGGIFILFLFGKSLAQPPGGVAYFSYPLSIKPKLNANFGEMRNNHFHMGLDLSTEGRENLPVFAPAEGYIARIKIESGGFGRAIYINHPNGTTTLYAHMNRFIPAAETFLKSKQYEQKTWKIDVVVPENLIPLKKGQLIGYSGNTGASQGPHVHFEIRDTKTENCLNPLLYRFPLADVTPPDIYRLVFYDRDKSIYEQSPITCNLIRQGNVFKTAGTIGLPFDKAFIAIQATDRMTGIPNPNGFFSATLLKDDQMVTGFELDNIGYDKTRYLNGHIDYMTRAKGGPYYQMLFPAKGFGLNIYTLGNAEKDHIDVQPEPSAYSIKVTDAYGNSAYLDFRVSRKPDDRPGHVVPGDRMEPLNVNIYEDENIQFVFREDAFYDAFHFRVNGYYANTANELSSVYQTLPADLPVQSNFTVRLKPNRSAALVNGDRVLIKRTYKTKTELKKAMPEKGWYTAAFRDFGYFQLLEDLQPPTISASVQSGAALRTGSRVVVDVADDNKMIREFRGTVDGQWLMFQPYGNRFVYTIDEHFPMGEHKLSIVVYDEAGNNSTRDFIIKRN
jgi:hypothetical protein